ncbi:unnamed protein product [Schistosoma mattheei]|uniref:Uncharacterized protein n=1 Tax=Schistosoma mattheei TaxID=31246 RepID=A0A183Q1I7_9TREM|nr:unnamed protein product [Schistosoma mattheei]
MVVGGSQQEILDPGFVLFGTQTIDKNQERKNKKTIIRNSLTRAGKFRAQAEYAEVNSQVKRSNIADKEKYVEDLATTAEKAAREGNMRHPYDIAKKLVGKYSKPGKTVKEKRQDTHR